MSYRTRIAVSGRVAKQRFETLDAALEHLEAQLRPLAARTDRGVARALGREYSPREQVVARGELAGPRRLRAGVDVLGDGSTAAFTGRLRRTPLPVQDGEDGLQALRRTAMRR